MIVAVDTGGTKTLIEAFDDDGKKKFLNKFPTPRDQHEYIKRVTQVIAHHTHPGSVEAIVVALPGPIKDGVVVRTSNIGWEQFDVRSHLQARFPSTNIYVGNDADLAGLAETRALERKHAPSLSLYVTLSTGIGTGVCFNGRLFPSLSRFEGGSMRLHYDGELQRWEDFASGRNFHERYDQYGRDVDDPEKWQDYAERVSMGLVALIPLLEPETLIIGGSMGTHFEKYAHFLDEILRDKIPIPMKTLSVTQAKHPEEAVVYGCYYYALDELAR
ncbi:MAG TPA: ROK family protein [Patescibacteria group bacterium]|jgi:predicted NBD/HSP70 family sugar kinase|nr:ROK family protein [Patescibacteria group bacterium]